MAHNIVQLDLNRSPWAYRARSLLVLSDRLLAAIAENVPDVSNKRPQAMRDRIDHWRRALQAEDDPDTLGALAKDIATDCNTILGHAKRERGELEVEISDLARLLRDAFRDLHKDAQTYEREFQESTSAIERIASLQDVRELKRQLTHELDNLKQSAARRQQSDAARVRRFEGEIRTLEGRLEEAREAATTDPLTGVGNRGAFGTSLDQWLGRAASANQGFTLALADLDDFKAVNDIHGHQVGDRVLVAAALLLKATGQDGDEIFRYGGEEFALLFKTPSASQAASRLTAALESLAPAYEYQRGNETCRVSFSFSAGVTTFVSGDDAESLIHRADEALYEAKRHGKRRVEIRAVSRLQALFRPSKRTERPAKAGGGTG